MPGRDPKYIRLAEHLNDATQADIAGGSGWAISGNAVLPFPEDDEDAARFVRQKLAIGVLEPAGKAEFDEQQKDNEVLAQVALSGETLQENRIQTVSQEAAKKRASKRKAAASAQENGDDEEENSNS